MEVDRIMQMITDLKPLRLYSAKRRIYIPFNPANRRKGANIKLLTRSMEDSVKLMNLPYMYNPKLYFSYYMTRNVMAYVDSKGIIDHDAEEEEESIIEAVMRKPGKLSYEAIYGTPNDEKALADNFSKKNFKDWLTAIGKPNYPIEVTVYGFPAVKDIAKAINNQAIITYSDFIQNSYCSEKEIFVVNRSGFPSIAKSEIDYEMYCKNELITWCIMNSYKTSRRVANIFGSALSGYYTKEYEDLKKKGKDVDKDIVFGYMLNKAYLEKGAGFIKEILVKRDFTPLRRYAASEFGNALKGLIDKLYDLVVNECFAYEEEEVLNESEGTHDDCVAVYKAMDNRDAHFLDGGFDYENMPGRDVIYRNIIRGKDGLYDIKGFIEVTHDKISEQPNGDPGAIIIGVHPKYRREGVAGELVKLMMKELPQEAPNVKCLIWRANVKNIASIKLAKKNGFKLVRQNSVQVQLRYDFSPIPAYNRLRDNILNEYDLAKEMAKYKYPKTDSSDYPDWNNADYFIFPDQLDKINYQSTNVNQAIICSAYLTKMGLHNRIVGFVIVEKNKHIESTEECYPTKVHFFNVLAYSHQWYGIDSSLSPGKVFEFKNIDIEKPLGKQFCEAIKNGIVYPKPSDFSEIVGYYSILTDWRFMLRDRQSGKNNFFDLNAYLYANGNRGLKRDPNSFNDVVSLYESSATYNFKRNSHIPLPTLALNETAESRGYYENDDFFLIDDLIFFNEAVDGSYDQKIRRWLYPQRIRMNRELIDVYNRLKARDPKIKKTFLRLEQYRSFNLFVDLHYYNDMFLNKMTFVKDKAVLMYWDFMKRLLQDSAEMSNRYSMSTILIPVNNHAWKVPNGAHIWNYRETINPISVFIRMMKINPDELKREWGNKRIVFVGDNGYFMLNFNDLEYGRLGRIRNFINKLASNTDVKESDSYDEELEDVQDDDEDTTSAIAMNIIDKVEKSTGKEINNVSSVVKNKAPNDTSEINLPILRIRDDLIRLDNSTAEDNGNGRNIGFCIVADTDDKAFDTITDILDNILVINKSAKINNIVYLD